MKPLEDVETRFVVTSSDVVRFNKIQLIRAKTNLLNAEKRGDKRAAENIRRKMAIYQHTIAIATYYNEQGLEIQKKIQETGD